MFGPYLRGHIESFKTERNGKQVAATVTIAAMFVPLAASAERGYLYVVAFALIGIGNTVLIVCIGYLFLLGVFANRKA